MNFNLKNFLYQAVGFILGGIIMWWGTQADDDFLLLLKAQMGDVRAQKTPGKMNIKKVDWSLRWYLKAAEKGDAEAQMMAGTELFSQGNFVDAAIWLRKAAEQGMAAPELGEMYFEGRDGVARNDADAAKFLRAALEQGHCGGKAVPELAQLYNEGRGVARNPEEACFWSFATYDAMPMLADAAKVCRALDASGLQRVQSRLRDWKKAHPKPCEGT